MTDFVHLHVHSAYSLLNGGPGASSLEALAAAAVERGMAALALTDLNGVYGAMDFRRVAAAYGLRPVYGASLETPTEHAVLLPLDAAGWASLCRAVTARHGEDNFAISRQLSADRTGLAILSSDITLLDRLARESGTEHLYVELVPGRGREAARAFAGRHGLPPVATNAVWFAHPQDHARHRLLAAISHNATLSTLPADALAPRDAWLKPGPEMARLFPDCPEALRNTVDLAERCGGGPPDGRVILPAFAGAEALAKLRELTVLGARRRYGAEILSPVVSERIEHELAVIAAKHYADYFLVVWDVVTHAPTHCGRGSVANSIVSYCLGLTHVDPLAQGLVFERFLNPGRRDPPDADLDFPWDERDRALEYVFRKYAAGRAAMVANHVTFQRKAALREVAKVYGRPATEITALTKRLPWADGGPLPALLATHPNFRSLALGGPWPEIASLAESLVGLPRNLSLHPGGVVIVPDALTNYVPVEPAAKRIDATDGPGAGGGTLPVPTIQFEKDGTEDAGLVKIDLLGNRSLAVIRDAIAAVREHEGVTIDYTSCDPEADEPTRQVFRTGNTMGVFYTESPASRLLCQKSRADTFDLLVLNTSIIRPASNRYINTYLARLHGAPYEPPHPVLRDVLAETFGVMVYQEDVVNVCVALAGMDVAEADGVRKALTKKRPLKELRGYEAQFRAGAAARGVAPKVIDDVWDMILSFSGYSFCKGHSASYIQVALQSGYLRAHYPAEFMAAVLSNEGGYYAPFVYIAEARRMGLAILPPDVNASEAHYTGRGRELRIGLQALKRLSADGLARLVAERRPYGSLEELRWRAGLAPGDLRVLIQSGACDGIAQGRTRPQLMWLVDATLGGHRPGVSRSQGALDLADTAPAPPLAEYDADRQLRDEYTVLGYLASRHPMALFADTLRAVRPVPAPRLPDHVGKLVTCAGMLTTAKPVHTIRDEPMEFVTFDDGAGLIETVIFPDVYRRVVPLLFGTGPYLLRGRVEESYGAITLTVTGLERLERYAQRRGLPWLPAPDEGANLLGHGPSTPA
ncbi:MAG: DNA polymerase III subunit alpha [Gemmatimonadetes bacterium]|nr:MAG: DNA polymerase III subunit alpha [Gemmatimonadota bacterium]